MEFNRYCERGAHLGPNLKYLAELKTEDLG